MPPSGIESSNGFLPLAPLSHDQPTAVGVIELASRSTTAWPLGMDGQRAHDQLLLVRLHGQPLTLLHLDGPPSDDDRGRIVDAVWERARAQLESHVAVCRCLPIPLTHDGLRSRLEDSSGSCSCLTPPRPSGRAAVIICTAGRVAELRRALESLTRLVDEDFELVVVDNRPSIPGTRELVEQMAADAPIRYVAEPRPGLARARNAGVHAVAAAEYVAFTDDDVIVDPGWLAWLLAPFADHGVDGVTGLVLPLRLDSAPQKRFELYAGFGKGVNREVYDITEHRADDRFLFPYWGGMFGSGNSMAFRRRALLTVGGFDPALGAGTPTAGGEDIAAFTDVILAGGQLVYEPRSLCWHEHRGDESALRDQVHNYGTGLTAVLWRYLTTDWRFAVRLGASLVAITRLARSRSEDRETDRLPSDLARLEVRGRLLGPWRYTLSRRAARRSAKR